MILTRAHLRYGETVLVNAAGSGVGVAAIQVAKLHGARVIASAGSDEKLEKARGARRRRRASTTRRSDLAEEARKLTGGRGVDMVVENVGAEIMEKSIQALARNGRVVTCGATAGNNATFNVSRFFLSPADDLRLVHGHEGRDCCATSRASTTDACARSSIACTRSATPARPSRGMLQREQFGKIVLVP